MSSAEILRVRLQCDHRAPQLARRALEGLDAIRPVHDDALLVASELATTAVLHAGGDSDREIELSAELVPDGLQIAITDAGPGAGQSPARNGKPPALVGVSLRVIQAVSRRWGADPANGARVWAVLPI